MLFLAQLWLLCNIFGLSASASLDQWCAIHELDLGCFSVHRIGIGMEMRGKNISIGIGMELKNLGQNLNWTVSDCSRNCTSLHLTAFTIETTFHRQCTFQAFSSECFFAFTLLVIWPVLKAQSFRFQRVSLFLSLFRLKRVARWRMDDQEWLASIVHSYWSLFRLNP